MNARSLKRGGHRKGAVAVEMAMVSPLFILLIFGIFESARVGMATQLLNAAAREGCRVAVLEGKTQDDVQSRVEEVLTGSGIEIGTVTPTPSDWDSSAAGTAITVELTVSYGELSWLGDPFGLAPMNLSASMTMSSERER
jgi:Flp pilus assembly protein TadG